MNRDEIVEATPICTKCGKPLSEVVMPFFQHDGNDTNERRPFTCTKNDDGTYTACIEASRAWCGYGLPDSERKEAIRCPHCKKYPFDDESEVEESEPLVVLCWTAEAQEKPNACLKPDPRWKERCEKCFENNACEPPECRYFDGEDCQSPIPNQHPMAQPGNAAAMREALLRCNAIAQLPEVRNEQSIKDMHNIIKRALATPATAEKSSAGGNAAATCEALVRVRGWLERMNKEGLDAFAESQITPAYAVNRQAKTIIEGNKYHIGQINAALALPRLNCEVGTAEEQAERFKAYCGQEVCKRASCQFHAKASFIGACAIAWAQMPYEAEEGGAA